MWNQKWDKVVEGEKLAEFVRTERSHEVLDVEITGSLTPIFQERTWDEEEESMTGLMCSLRGKYHSAITGKQIADTDSENAKKSSQRRLFVEERLCVHRYKKYYPIKQEELYKDRQGNWKQTWRH